MGFFVVFLMFMGFLLFFDVYGFFIRRCVRQEALQDALQIPLHQLLS